MKENIALEKSYSLALRIVRLLRDSGLIEKKEAEELMAELDELLRITGSIKKTMNKKLNPISLLSFLTLVTLNF
jgi:hypothetical protein